MSSVYRFFYDALISQPLRCLNSLPDIRAVWLHPSDFTWRDFDAAFPDHNKDVLLKTSDGFIKGWIEDGRSYPIRNLTIEAWCELPPPPLECSAWTRHNAAPILEGKYLIFLNGQCELHDTKSRNGGGWGIRIWEFKQDKWMPHDKRDLPYITHYMPLPKDGMSTRECHSYLK